MGTGLLGLDPDAFWRLTPFEFNTKLHGWALKRGIVKWERKDNVSIEQRKADFEYLVNNLDGK